MNREKITSGHAWKILGCCTGATRLLAATVMLALGIGVALPTSALTTTNTFSGGQLLLADNQNSIPYPYTLTVTGTVGPVVDVSVTLNGFGHSYLPDIDMLLVSPDGRASYLMSDVGGGNPGITNASITFKDESANSIQAGVIPTNGMYKPSKFYPSGDVDNFPTAPAGPYQADLKVFNGMASANGDWKIFSLDDAAGDYGVISSVSLTLVTQSGPNQNPTISDIKDQFTSKDTSTPAIAFVVGDAETPAGSLTVTASSTDTNLVPAANITIAKVPTGAPGDRTITILPGLHLFGTCTITVTVDDGQGGKASDSFQLTVYDVNNPPTIAYTGGTFTINEVGTGHPTPNSVGPIEILIGDVETPATNLVVLANTSNKDLIPQANVVITGQGANRQATITPVAYRFGSARIIITVTDSGNLNTAGPELIINVTSIPDPPKWTVMTQTNDFLESQTGTDSFNATFAFSDHESLPNSPADMAILMSSPDQNWIANTNIAAIDTTLSPDGIMSGKLKITPNRYAFGTNLLTLTVSNKVTHLTDVVYTWVRIQAVPTPLVIKIINPTVSINEETLGTNLFAVYDYDDYGANTILQYSSSNTGLVPNGNIFGPAGAPTVNDQTNQVVMQPLPYMRGSATITIAATNTIDHRVTLASFVLNVAFVNHAPIIGIPTTNYTLLEGDAVGVLVPFSVDDPFESLATNLTVQAFPTNTVIIPNDTNHIKFVNLDGTNRTVQIIADPNGYGTDRVDLVVTDENGGKATNSIYITITGINDPPVIANLPPAFSTSDAIAKTLVFQVSDNTGGIVETPADQIQVTATSGNTGVVPNANIIIGANGGNRSLFIQPIDQNLPPGSSVIVPITITVTDNGVPLPAISVISNVVLTINARNDAPTIAVTNKVTLPEDSIITIPFVIGDRETPATDLGLETPTSSNAGLLPASNLYYAGTGANRLLFIQPAPNSNGVSTITIGVNDGTNKTLATIEVTVTPVPDAPVVGSIPNQMQVGTNMNQIVENTTRTLTFTVADPDGGSADTMTYGATVAYGTDTNLFTNGDAFTFGGSGGNRTLTIKPNVNRFGSNNVVTVKVTNPGSGLFSTTAFQVDVVATNMHPQLIGVPSVIHLMERAGGTNFSVQISDVETHYSLFKGYGETNFDGNVPMIYVISSNESVLPTANVKILGGTNETRSISLFPIFATFGTNTLQVIIVDNGFLGYPPAYTTNTITVEVENINDPPSISPIPNITIAQNGSTVIAFSIDDQETKDYAKLNVNAVSLDPSLIPNLTNNLYAFGTNATRNLFIKPVANKIGSTIIRVSVTDDGTPPLTTTREFQVTVSQVNQAPTILGPDKYRMAENTEPFGVVDFLIADLETPFTNLLVAVTSSNPAVPTPNIFMTFKDTPNESGLGANAATITLRLFTQTNSYATNNVTISVNDGTNTATKVFSLEVYWVNQKPYFVGTAGVNSFLDITNTVNTTTGLHFLVGDVEDGAAGKLGLLFVKATSSDQSIIPDSNLVIGRNGANGILNITPAPNKGGVVTITMSVTDTAGATTSVTFKAIITGGNLPPTLSQIADQTMDQNSTKTVPFTVTDDKTPAADLLTVATSSNPTLINSANLFIFGSGNARSIMIVPATGQNGQATITIIATDTDGSISQSSFLVTVKKPAVQNPSDLDGDGKSDIMLQNNDGRVAVWFMDGAHVKGGQFLNPANPGATWKVQGMGDFNTDGEMDVLMRNTADNTLGVWYMNGLSYVAGALTTPSDPGSDWTVVAVYDMDKDGYPDIVLQATDGTIGVWYMGNNATLKSGALLNPAGPSDPNFRVAGVGDLDGNGTADVVLQNRVTGEIGVWFMNGLTLDHGSFTSPSAPGDLAFKVSAVADLNGDGKADLVLYDGTTLAVWFMQGANMLSGSFFDTNPGEIGWNVVGP